MSSFYTVPLFEGTTLFMLEVSANEYCRLYITSECSDSRLRVADMLSDSKCGTPQRTRRCSVLRVGLRGCKLICSISRRLMRCSVLRLGWAEGMQRCCSVMNSGYEVLLLWIGAGHTNLMLCCGSLEKAKGRYHVGIRQDAD